MDETAYETSYGESEPKPKKPAKRKAKPALKALPNIEQVAAFLKSVYEVEGGDIKGALAVAGKSGAAFLVDSSGITGVVLDYRTYNELVKSAAGDGGLQGIR